MDALPYSEACERNKEPILDMLRGRLAGNRRVLEIGSGTGQHAVHFAAGLPQLEWQPTERPVHLAALAARVAREGGANLTAPVALDVTLRPWAAGSADAVFTANTLHIMSWPEVVALFAGLDGVLRHPGVLCIYGPFRYGGRHTSPSNERFDRELRARDPASGLRDIEEVTRLATGCGLTLEADHDLPANNRLLIYAA